MKDTVEKRKPSGRVDHLALALTTFGVGYIPGPTGTYGSAIGVAIFLCVDYCIQVLGSSGDLLCFICEPPQAHTVAFLAVVLLAFCLIGIWASGRTMAIFGNSDPSEAVVDEVMGQLITFAFIPFGLNWPFILAGFLLFRLFDIWKPFPIDDLQRLPGGLGVCADDIVAGVYAGICLAVGYAIYIAI